MQIDCVDAEVDMHEVKFLDFVGIPVAGDADIVAMHGETEAGGFIHDIGADDLRGLFGGGRVGTEIVQVAL